MGVACAPSDPRVEGCVDDDEGQPAGDQPEPRRPQTSQMDGLGEELEGKRRDQRTAGKGEQPAAACCLARRRQTTTRWAAW